MLAFVTIGTNNIQSASEFYDKVLFPLDIVKIISTDRYAGYANINTPHNIQLYIIKPYNEELATSGNGVMITFLAKSKKIVDTFYQIGLQSGGTDEGSPGPRHKKDYYAYLRDIEGNKICAIFYD